MTWCWCVSQFKWGINNSSGYNMRRAETHKASEGTSQWGLHFVLVRRVSTETQCGGCGKRELFLFFPTLFSQRSPLITCHFLGEQNEKVPTCQHTQKWIWYHRGSSLPESILIRYQAWLPCRKPLWWLWVLEIWLAGDSWDTKWSGPWSEEEQ